MAVTNVDILCIKYSIIDFVKWRGFYLSIVNRKGGEGGGDRCGGLINPVLCSSYIQVDG